MNCLRCNATNEEKERYCKNCGMDLYGVDNTEPKQPGKLRKFLFVFQWIGFVITFTWWIIERLIIPLFFKKGGSVDWENILPVFRDNSWPADLAIVFFLSIIFMIIKDRDAKKLMLIVTLFLSVCIILGWFLGYA